MASRFCIDAVRKNDFLPVLFAFSLYHGLKLQSRVVVLELLRLHRHVELECLCEAHLKSCLTLFFHKCFHNGSSISSAEVLEVSDLVPSVPTNGATMEDSDPLDTIALPSRPGMYSLRA